MHQLAKLSVLPQHNSAAYFIAGSVTLAKANHISCDSPFIEVYATNPVTKTHLVSKSGDSADPVTVRKHMVLSMPPVDIQRETFAAEGCFCPSVFGSQ